MTVHPDLAHFVKLLPEPAFLAESSGRLVLANEAAARIAGVEPAALAGLCFATLVVDPAEKVTEFLRLCARSRQFVPGSFRWLGASGQALEMRCDGAVLVPRTDAAPALLFLRGRPKDEATDRFSLLNRKIEALSAEVLERKRIQQERDALLERERDARVDAERLSRIKDEFLATLSHELRTPLNAILGWANLLQKPAVQARELTPGLAAIERNARAQAKIVEDLLDMSRIVAGKVRLDVQQVALAPLIKEVLDSIQPAADAKGVRLQSTLDPIAGPVKGDPNRLQQIVWNLVTNAVKFSSNGGRVHVYLERVNSHLEIIVTDAGAGIAPDFLPHIFDRFQQADGSTTRRYGGLGLGLSIVKQLSELHGGSVRAKSPGLNQGTTFIVSLPLAPAHDSSAESGRFRQHPIADSSRVAELPPRAVNGIRVLVIDDEADAREFLETLLAGHGATVTVAGSVEAGLAAVATHRPHVVLCDIGMPGEDGYEFVRRLRAWAPERGGHTPAVAVTAFARVEDRTRALLAGFNGHLAKPVEPDELIAMTANLAGAFVAATFAGPESGA